MALVLAAAALVRGTVEPQRLPWILPAACAWAGMAALAGLWLWNPYGAWPEWYTFVWLPALVGVLVPAPRPSAVLGIGTVAGTAAARVTGGAVVGARLARMDLPPSLPAALGRSPETARAPRVERLERSPGVHYVLVAPLAGGDVLTVGVGPRTRLIPLARIARFLQGEASVEPPYDI